MNHFVFYIQSSKFDHISPDHLPKLLDQLIKTINAKELSSSQVASRSLLSYSTYSLISKPLLEDGGGGSNKKCSSALSWSKKSSSCNNNNNVILRSLRGGDKRALHPGKFLYACICLIKKCVIFYNNFCLQFMHYQTDPLLEQEVLATQLFIQNFINE